MKRYGYARVGSIGQSLDVQLAKLSGCDDVYREQAGIDEQRPQLKACLARVRRGDTLVVTRLDRLVRSTLDLHRTYDQLEKNGVALQVIDQNIDTRKSHGRKLLNMLGFVIEFEAELRAERQADGIAKAKERGVRFGRMPKVTPSQIVEIRDRRDEGALIETLMQDYGISKGTVYNCLALKERGIGPRKRCVLKKLDGLGRKLKLNPKQILELRKRRKQGALIESLARDYGISRALVYKYLQMR